MKTFKVGDRVTVKSSPDIPKDLIFVVTNIDPSFGPHSGPFYTILSKEGGDTIKGWGFTGDMLILVGPQARCSLSKLLKSGG